MVAGGDAPSVVLLLLDPVGVEQLGRSAGARRPRQNTRGNGGDA